MPKIMITVFILLLIFAWHPYHKITGVPVPEKESGFDVVEINSVPFYQLVRYFTAQTERRDPKVHDLNISHFLYYTHVYHAWREADDHYSQVALKKNTQDIIGANMVYKVEALQKMYAPGKIGAVLDFVTPCYESVKPRKNSTGFISTLRPYASDAVNRAMIREVAHRFQTNAAPNTYHLLWENKTIMDNFLKKLSYKQMACGNSTLTGNKCDWTRMGLPKSFASSLCIYRLNKP